MQLGNTNATEITEFIQQTCEYSGELDIQRTPDGWEAVWADDPTPFYFQDESEVREFCNRVLTNFGNT